MPLNKSDLYQQPKIFAPYNALILAQSTRKGGISQAPYHSLNLGLYTNDKNEYVAENRHRFFSSLQIQAKQIAESYQVHGNLVKVIQEPGQLEGFDALITNKKNIFLTVTIADCVPILVFDPQREVVAAVHAGWRGTAANILSLTLTAMTQHYDTKAKDCLAFIGTCIDGTCYEVGLEVAAHFSNEQKRWDKIRNKYFVDLKKANRDQLLAAGLLPEKIEVSPFSTVENNDTFFSHRLENGTTGRMLAVIGMKEEGS